MHYDHISFHAEAPDDPADLPEPPRAKLKDFIIILAILLAAAWLLETMWAA